MKMFNVRNPKLIRFPETEFMLFSILIILAPSQSQLASQMAEISENFPVIDNMLKSLLLNQKKGALKAPRCIDAFWHLAMALTTPCFCTKNELACDCENELFYDIRFRYTYL